MNTTIQSLTLRDAVIAQIQEFINSGTSFSRYDITLALRKKCNQGELQIPEVATGGVNIKFWVKKEAVDDIFEDIYQNPSNVGLPLLRASVNPGTGYRIFEIDPLTAQQTAQTPNPTSVASTGYASAPITSPQLSAPTPSAGPLNDTEIRRRIERYLKRCTSNGKSLTLKKIQSAIKRGNKSTGLSCGEIFNIASSLGYKI